MTGHDTSTQALFSFPLLFLLTLCLYGCGAQDDAPQTDHVVQIGDSMDEQDIRNQGKADTTEPPDDVVIEQEEPYEEDPDRYPLFETVRYVKQYKDCAEPICMMDVRFGIRGGSFSRYQRGMMTSHFELSDEHRARLRDLVGRDREIGKLLYSEADISCDMLDPRRVDYHVELELSVYIDRNTLEYYTHDISHCSANSAEEPIDPLEQFILDVNSSYGFD